MRVGPNAREILSIVLSFLSAGPELRFNGAFIVPPIAGGISRDGREPGQPLRGRVLLGGGEERQGRKGAQTGHPAPRSARGGGERQ